MSDPSSHLAHACLVGPCFVRDCELMTLLARDFLVTLVPHVAQIAAAPLLPSVDILLLDCGLEPAATLAFVPELRRRHGSLDIVLVDGGVTQHQLAGAFAAGARDYFPADCEPHLLAGRVRGLAHLRQRTANTIVSPATEGSDPP